MHVEDECLPCLLRLGRGCVARAGLSAGQAEAVEQRIEALLRGVDRALPTPVVARQIQRMVLEASGQTDLYADERRRSNAAVLARRRELGQRIRDRGPDALATAIKLAVAGNVIDFAAEQTFSLQGALDRALGGAPAVDEIPALIRALGRARRLLYLADNAGEIVLDGLLLEQLGADGPQVTLAVRGGPIINDAVRDDAAEAGLPAHVRIIDSGVDLPGTRHELAGASLRSALERADLVISKGQGNFETLVDQPGPPTFFLFVVKCSVVSRAIGIPEGAAVVGSRETLHNCPVATTNGHLS